MDVNLERIAKVLKLEIHEPKIDPVHGIILDIGRLQYVSRLWNEACNIARQHCPVDIGKSHIREGIPRLAARANHQERLINEVTKIFNQWRASESSTTHDAMIRIGAVLGLV